MTKRSQCLVFTLSCAVQFTVGVVLYSGLWWPLQVKDDIYLLFLLFLCCIYAFISQSIVGRWQETSRKEDVKTLNCKASSTFIWVNLTCAVEGFCCEVSDKRLHHADINQQENSFKSTLRKTDRKCNLVHGCGVSPERTHSSLVPWSQNSWTWARPRDRNFSTMDCSLAVLAFSSSRISLLTWHEITFTSELQTILLLTSSPLQ